MVDIFRSDGQVGILLTDEEAMHLHAVVGSIIHVNPVRKTCNALFHQLCVHFEYTAMEGAVRSSLQLNPKWEGRSR